MAYFQKSKTDDDRRRCKRHPKHRQSPGVCSLCLTEKLSQIATSSSSSSSRKTSASLHSSSSSSSYYSSASSSCSSCSSPNPHGYNMDRRSKASIIFSSSSIFKKSRSMAFAPRLLRRSGRENDSGKKSNLGFWSRFLSRPRRKRMEMEEVLTHSRTVVQRDVHG